MNGEVMDTPLSDMTRAGLELGAVGLVEKNVALRAEVERLQVENEKLSRMLAHAGESIIEQDSEVEQLRAWVREAIPALYRSWSFDEYQQHTHSWHCREDWMRDHGLRVARFFHDGCEEDCRSGSVYCRKCRDAWAALLREGE